MSANNSANANLSHFVLWNNRGADLLQRGRYMMAIECFSKSLVHIQGQIKTAKSRAPEPGSRQQGIQDVAEHICITPPADAAATGENGVSNNDIAGPDSDAHVDSANNDVSNDESNDDTNLEAKPLHECQKQKKAQAAVQASPRSSDIITDRVREGGDNAFVYRRPVRLSPTLAEVQQPLSTSVLRPLSVLVIINTAIAHHLLANGEEEGSPRAAPSMKRAIVLYEMALQTQSQQLCLQPLGMSGFHLLLACYNNLGFAQKVRSQTKAELCFRSLLSLLMWSVVHSAVPAVTIDCYWSTVGHLLSTTPAPAAAA